jgi:hypothetical protein
MPEFLAIAAGVGTIGCLLLVGKGLAAGAAEAESDVADGVAAALAIAAVGGGIALIVYAWKKGKK